MAAQSSYTYTVLPEQAQEDALHATRLLQVEERPFSRVQRKLLEKDTSLLRLTPQQLPSPPPEGTDVGRPKRHEDDAAKLEKFHQDTLLDFAALESSILRIQLIHASNQRERSRYAAEKAKILETASAVRNNTLALRAQLAEAQRMLELRKGYDDLASKLKLVGSEKRSETREESEKLQKEIEDLEQEGADYGGIWLSRREAFDRVVGEGEAMVRLIKGVKDDGNGEKEEESPQDRMDEDGKEDRSRVGTPVPGSGTPMPMLAGGATPLPESGEIRPANRFLDVEDAATRVSSRAESPLAQPGQADVDVEMAMAEEEERPLEPQAKTSTGMEVSGNQVAVPAETEGTGEQMDES